MAVELTSPVEGKQAGASYSGPLEDFYVLGGYAKRDGEGDLHRATAVDADTDPTLAANREGPDDGERKHSGKTVKAVEGKNAPEVGLGEPLKVEGEAAGPANATERTPGLEEAAKRAEADVKGGVVDPAPGVEESAGAGQEVPAKEEPTQDGDSAGA